MIIAIAAALIFALSLCADCFAVSVCSSVTLKKIDWPSVMKISIIFGLMQAGLMLVGFGFGDLFVGYIEKVAGWIGFGLLLYVGGSMIKEGFEDEEEARDLNGLRNILVGAVATSIDALAVGISLSLSHDSWGDFLMKDVAVLIVTIASVIVGMFCGQKIGNKYGKIAEIIGGLVLIGIGIGILI